MNIYDNTLREGSQNADIYMDLDQKIKILDAQILAGIRIIEVGFIAVGEKERDDIKNLILRGRGSELYCLSRLKKEDIDDCVRVGCKNITMFVPSSDGLLKNKIKKNVNEVKKDISEAVRYAKSYGMKVRFSCEGATETPINRLIDFYRTAIEAGAHTVSVPDTSGVMIPSEMYKLIKKLKSEVAGKISMHCHNDLGVATANAIAGVEAGADEIQTSVLGLGERVGNSDLLEILIILKKYFDSDCGLNLIKIRILYESVATILGIDIDKNKPIIGENQFVHESGLHVRAVAQGIGYEAFPPQWIGRKHVVVYGAQSGTANVEFFVDKNHISKNKIDISEVVNELKECANRLKRNLTDDEMRQLIKKNETVD